ncbi:50S ribosomal protein L19 [Candidatus Jorgensenbacteria bacterium CG03_land_8_20_14_0_80_38_39]|uniref:50S ribosomal protein L19 n=1 Tax=Candidatus Jorgensenbacteria bacterium CG11_big_fil_rev_8_21_14_0_20_38_23 TaxID=1974594 RepID=A0A2H0NCY3_9BACT|nr:MAG: 50S ribosomal protein L19 [Candidatus Jorgensenbacteria bacterium CG11_big_fil_rev_8_21_14_0_20_38_23]PIV13065.1 MAG: 50S ribosomal protein L19 [Candidatus Jorgensenbacteria bacterium CG03_land_8_20_14_0_80_38_39]PJA94950.1 MAG: 50S ribosomal protein L19 [Candidatus Jorgensenbacteria bacterium CG_4_9_14_3_um_filter_38_10]
MDKEILNKIKPGARIKVWERIKEGGKERPSPFEGIVIARKHGNEPGATIMVRGIFQEIGVEKIYPIHSPLIAKIEILEQPKKIHRAKLYFLRKLSQKKIRQKIGRPA